MKESKIFSKFLFGILIILFLAAEVNYIRLYVRSDRVVRQGATVEAVVSDMRRSSGRGRTHHILYVDYEINGIQYTKVNYGADLSNHIQVGDTCIAYYDIKDPGFVTAGDSPNNYAKSIQNMGCLILFAIVSIWFVYYIKKEKITMERFAKALLVLIIVMIIVFIVVIKNEI